MRALSRNEASRFRITPFPDLPTAPSEVAVPRLVGVLSAPEVLPALPEGFVALTPDGAEIEVFFDECVAEQAINGPGSDDFIEQLHGFVADINRYRRWH